MPALTLEEVARLVGGEARGGPGSPITAVCGLDQVAPGAVTFVESGRLVPRAEATPAAALLAPPGTVSRLPTVWVDNPRYAFARLLAVFHPPRRPPAGVHPTAAVDPSARLDPETFIGPFCSVAAGCRVGAGVELRARVVLEEGARVGPGSRLFPGVRVGKGASVGERCQLHPGSVLAPGAVLGDEVEVGARASLGACFVGQGTKIDNLVRVGDMARVGRWVLLVSQCLVGPGAQIGDHAVVAGQAVVEPGVVVGEFVQVAARARVRRDLAEKGAYSGDPARPHRVDLRLEAARARAPEFLDRLARREAGTPGCSPGV